MYQTNKTNKLLLKQAVFMEVQQSVAPELALVLLQRGRQCLTMD